MRTALIPHLTHILAALGWCFILAVIGLELLVRLDLFTSLFLNALGVPGRIPNAMELHHGVMGFLLAGTPLPAGFGPKEARHFADVAALLSSLRWAGLAALALAVSLGLSRKALARDLRLGALLLPALLMGLGLTALEWPLFFTAFHPLLFPGGGYSFNPHVHLIVRLYPKAYFAWMAATLLAVTGLLALAVYAAARLRAGAGEAGRWRPNRVSLWIAGAGLLLAVPTFHAGQNSLTPLSPCFLAYYLISVILLAGSAILWTTRAKAVGLSVLLAALLAYAGLDLGLRETNAKALETMRRGDSLVQAIQAHARHTGRLPTRLDQIVPAQLPFLPPVLIQGSQWKYTVQGDRFFLGFVGPLGYHFQYASHRDRWKWLDL
ncbi:putative membrane protein [Desulfocurvibacter africanus PCS]|uniref:Putative membrane protein n=1 Tax=Desulfocurvibacter africanus PCS TaxID=1262666 RepID=M5Q0L7_DESAF|nr:DUF1461 domain-containing protein [Desulfocurvibacter africanus]EMG36806.1 putative membrane protein [Desulfocurvibacter africanus PCS]